MATAPKKNGNGHLRTWGAYVFRTKDPAINELRTVIEDEFGHRVNSKDLAQIHKDGGPTVSCMQAWFFGKTRCPQNPTLEAAGRAMGFQRVWQRQRKT